MLVDLQGCRTFLRSECEICNVHERKENNTNCVPCYISRNSKAVGDEERIRQGKKSLKSRIGISEKFKRFGVNKISNHGKHHLYLYINYPKLNFSLPPVPDFDCLDSFNYETVSIYLLHNVKKRKKLRWNLHHINSVPYDDRKINLCLSLNTEHQKIHGLCNNDNYSEAKGLMTTIAYRNLQLFGETACPIDFEI